MMVFFRGYGSLAPHVMLGDLLKRHPHGQAIGSGSSSVLRFSGRSLDEFLQYPSVTLAHLDRLFTLSVGPESEPLIVSSLTDAPLTAGRLSTCSKAVPLGADGDRALRTAIGKALHELQRERLYVIGGLDNSFAPLALVERFDPLEGTWETLPPISTARHGACAAAFGGYLYVIGGEVNGVALRDVQRFAPRSGARRWETMPSTALGRIKAAATECQARNLLRFWGAWRVKRDSFRALGEGLLYVLGGNDGFTALRSVERYDPFEGRWQSVASMQKPRYAASAMAREDCILVFSGELSEEGAAASLEIYDIQANTWHLLPSLRSPLCGSVPILKASGDEVYSFGGAFCES
ncbi:Influenza virus NS1A-binding protein homolog A (NS1-BP homolog A) (NS1-binding protein homolog A) [Durusdinium trenchii]|uniref:Influenza virus NS1A-binding protein homolog A (NS1-BP homolog A) (NS1-binding protein homolog A) n=1 Tax=Durusdinium trenchii TaxID=1381693 RepID=A0ABP0QYM9_9DINO